MEALFLKIVNMSITAGYVILAVLLIRLLLKRAPKVYSYLLWSAVLFRLVCPVSYRSFISIFGIRPFDMTAAQQGGAAALSYLPADIGYQQTPKITVGIPVMNSALSESLPSAAPAASVNPLQIWILAGVILWCAGVAALLVYGIVTALRLKRQVADAVRLEENVFEAQIRSPFIAGLFRPRIYIPFGLNERERAYILEHERYHLKRKDHIVKTLGFLILILYWFNPLVWLAFALMVKDMEMSCDERVLSRSGGSIAHQYSLSLLSFAANRRFPAPSPLSFGETGLRERIKNILRFRSPKKWVVVLTAAVCITSIVACAANPITTPATTGGELYGNYLFEKQIYMNPLSSFIAFEGYRQYYTLTENSLIITNEDGTRQQMAASLIPSDVDEQEFNDSFMMEGFNKPDLSSYRQRTQYTLTDTSQPMIYRIYILDDDIWLTQLRMDNSGNEFIWSIYKITKYDGQTPVKISVSPTTDGVDDFLALLGDFKSGYDTDTCYSITPDYIRENSGYRIFKFDTSCASFLLYEDQVIPLGEWFGGFGVTSMALADLNADQKPELYFTFSWGSGLHRSHAAYFDPVEKQVAVFEYMCLSEDMIVADNGSGGLSLFKASVSGMTSFTEFEMTGTDFLSDIVYRDGQIVLDSPPAE